MMTEKYMLNDFIKRLKQTDR